MLVLTSSCSSSDREVDEGQQDSESLSLEDDDIDASSGNAPDTNGVEGDDEAGEVGGGSGDSGASGDSSGSDSDADTSGGEAPDPDTEANPEGGDEPEAGAQEESGGDANEGDSTALCGNKIYACGDGIDNDGDGLIDGADDECTSPCDNDEASFATGIPGDNVDCLQDCFFDGNSGSGDDKCSFDLRCDPENPGAGTKCEYDPEKSCASTEPSPECLGSCMDKVPNGCDCFGCCEVYTEEGVVTVFLGSGEDCSVTNLDGCEPCTINHDCENECEPELCEECIGDTPVPIECDEAECEDKVACESQADCPNGFWCSQGCCWPVHAE